MWIPSHEISRLKNENAQLKADLEKYSCLQAVLHNETGCGLGIHCKACKNATVVTEGIQTFVICKIVAAIRCPRYEPKDEETT